MPKINMTTKNPAYWVAHKEVVQDLLDELDSDIQDLVLKSPESLEAVRFNKKVHEEVKKRLDLKLD